MTSDYLSTIAIAVFAFLSMFALRHAVRKLLGRDLPRWLTPAVIAAAMFAYTIWNEYTWFDRVRAQLPDSVAILSQQSGPNPIRPWTHLWPITLRFIALDRAALQHSETRPELVRGELMLVERWRETQRVLAVWDCTKGARADLFDGASVTPEGTLSGAEWLELPKDDKGLEAACAT